LYSLIACNRNGTSIPCDLDGDGDEDEDEGSDEDEEEEEDGGCCCIVDAKRIGRSVGYLNA